MMQPFGMYWVSAMKMQRSKTMVGVMEPPVLIIGLSPKDFPSPISVKAVGYELMIIHASQEVQDRMGIDDATVEEDHVAIETDDRDQLDDRATVGNVGIGGGR
jgi:hypothetical protein